MQKKRGGIWLKCHWRRLIYILSSERSLLRAELASKTSLWLALLEILTPCSFLVGPLGQRHHEVDWALLAYGGRTLLERNQRAAKQKPMDGTQLPELHRTQRDMSISFQRAAHAVFICTLQNTPSLKAEGAEFPIILVGFILANAAVRGNFCEDQK